MVELSICDVVVLNGKTTINSFSFTPWNWFACLIFMINGMERWNLLTHCNEIKCFITWGVISFIKLVLFSDSFKTKAEMRGGVLSCIPVTHYLRLFTALWWPSLRTTTNNKITWNHFYILPIPWLRESGHNYYFFRKYILEIYFFRKYIKII